VGAIGVGKFSAEFTAANYGDVIMAQRGALAPDQVRRLTLSGVVDSGAVRLVLPRAIVLELGLPVTGTMIVRYANGMVAERDTVAGVAVELLSRQGVFTAIVEPRRRDALIGAIVLEDLDFLIDCKNEKIVPRHPGGPVYDI
jgi:predicted aspartyl protease